MNSKKMDKRDKETLTAVRAFTQMTIQDPSFFTKTPEEQKKIAYSMIQEQKEQKKHQE